MENIFDKIAQSAKDVSKGIVEQTKTTVSQSKLELDLLQAKADLKRLYTEIGEKVYLDRLYPDTAPRIEALYDRAFEKEKKIKELERSVINLRKEQRSNFESVKRDVNRTWNGEGEETRKPEPGEDGYLQMKFCAKCNIGNHPDAEYCVACGHKQN